MQLISAARQPIIRLSRTRTPPEMTFASRELRYHLFISHIWSSAQDQAATIKRQLQLLVPTASVFLDIDDLEDIGELEKYVAAAQTVLIVLSRGYFGSYNCKREVGAAASLLLGCVPPSFRLARVQQRRSSVPHTHHPMHAADPPARTRASPLPL